MKVQFLSVAEAELASGYRYYESASPGLGHRFLAEIELTVYRVVANPYAWMLLGDEMRRCRVHRFPYGLIYAIGGDVITIVAVAHLHRDPEHWRTRRDG